MFRILLFAAIVVALLSPVSAQQLAEPLAFSLDDAAGQVLAGVRPNDSTCVIGNGGGISLAYPANNAGTLRAANASPLKSAAFSGNAAAIYSRTLTWADAELPPLSLPDAWTSGYRHPRSLAWLPDSQPLFSVQESAHAMAFEVPLLFPGLRQREDRFSTTSSEREYTAATDFHNRRHAGETGTRSNRVGFVMASAPAAVVPAGLQDAMAGLHRLWNCVGSSPPQPEVQQQQQTETTEVQVQPGTALTFPGQVHELANNLGGLGRIYRADHSSGPALVVNRLVSATEEKLAFWVTQAEVDAAGVACFKASADDRIAATKQDNGNIVIAMGPDGENKTFHVIFNGGLTGGVGGTVTTHDGAPGAHC